MVAASILALSSVDFMLDVWQLTAVDGSGRLEGMGEDLDSGGGQTPSECDA